MSSLREALNDYLRIRRQLGFELKAHERLLNGFVDFLERAGAQHITTELALAWAKLPIDARPHYWRRRLGIVRAFARYVATIDPSSEVPAEDLLPATQPRVAPYIYSETEIAALMAAARALRPPLQAASIETLIGLMSSTGLRLGEALGLDRRDVDLRDGALHVRAAKQQKQREVPVHPTTTEALRDYARLRDRLCPAPDTAAFFLNPRGRRLHKASVHRVFPELIREVGLEGCGQRARPRPHDLRHAYAVRTLLGWHRHGEQVERKLPLLATFLGHYAGDRVKDEAGDRLRLGWRHVWSAGRLCRGGAAAMCRATCRSGADVAVRGGQRSIGRRWLCVLDAVDVALRPGLGSSLVCKREPGA